MMCPGDLERARAFGEAPAAELAAHLAACATCRATWDATQAMVELARELPVALPPAARREELRTALLAAASAAPAVPRGWLGRRLAAVSSATGRRWIAPVIAVAAAGVIAVIVWPSPPGHRTHGVVRPQPDARYVASGAGPDEIVWLVDGAIDVQVAPLHGEERYRVVVGSAEIEVRGTAFTVTARRNHLVDVVVAHGRVEVRPDGGLATVLGAGESWHASGATTAQPAPDARGPTAPLASATPAVQPSSAPATSGPTASATSPHVASPARRSAPAIAQATRAPAIAQATRAPAIAQATRAPAIAQALPEPPPAAAPAPGRAPEEVSYNEAWAALRADDFARAVSLFARVLLLAPDSPLVEDAAFWRAVALARGNRGAEAVPAFRDFLDSFGRAARAGEASAMLGWLLIDAHRYDEAATRFRAALRDPQPAVRRSAEAGLAALAPGRP